MYEAGVNLDIVDAQIGEFLKFGEVAPKMLKPDAPAYLSEACGRNLGRLQSLRKAPYSGISTHSGAA